ncbi:hypothetical protein B0F90DRAFT_1818956 [Multifurca ochricompacta]|uniref:Uncharacterized protein n=1 Tax=Multifurca ochricompacta TaxID=376703 RepID=A0AAD4QJF6_9AGAM|nr:hypothetical protein B0F90DRAFT_1818956 [Multifurca ochricompacta]
MADQSGEGGPSSAQYWSDAIQSRIEPVDDALRQVPSSALSDMTIFNLIDGEVLPSVAHYILDQIFLFYYHIFVLLYFRIMEVVIDACSIACSGVLSSGGSPVVTGAPLRWSIHDHDLNPGACSCSTLPWVRLLETAAPLVEILWLHVDAHCSWSLHDTPAGLLPNFLLTHLRLRRLLIEGASLSSWSGRRPLTQLTVLNIHAPSSRKLLVNVEHQQQQFAHTTDARGTLRLFAADAGLANHLSCSLPPAFLKGILDANCAPPAPLCRLVLNSLDIPPSAMIRVSCCPICPTFRQGPGQGPGPRKRQQRNSGGCGGGPHALSLSPSASSSSPSDTLRSDFLLTAWRSFVPPPSRRTGSITLVPNAQLIFASSPNGTPDTQTQIAPPSADWYDVVVGFVEIAHVATLDAPVEGVLDALKIPANTTSNTAYAADEIRESDGEESSTNAGAARTTGAAAGSPLLVPELVFSHTRRRQLNASERFGMEHDVFRDVAASSEPCLRDHLGPHRIAQLPCPSG